MDNFVWLRHLSANFKTWFLFSHSFHHWNPPPPLKDNSALLFLNKKEVAVQIRREGIINKELIFVNFCAIRIKHSYWKAELFEQVIGRNFVGIEREKKHYHVQTFSWLFIFVIINKWRRMNYEVMRNFNRWIQILFLPEL